MIFNRKNSFQTDNCEERVFSLQLLIKTVVRSFLCDVNIMWVRFFKGSSCDLCKFASFVEVFDCWATAISHTRTDTAFELEDYIFD
jgi:hypothetical protein